MKFVNHSTRRAQPEEPITLELKPRPDSSPDSSEYECVLPEYSPKITIVYDQDLLRMGADAVIYLVYKLRGALDRKDIQEINHLLGIPDGKERAELQTMYAKFSFINGSNSSQFVYEFTKNYRKFFDVITNERDRVDLEELEEAIAAFYDIDGFIEHVNSARETHHVLEERYRSIAPFMGVLLFQASRKNT